MINKKIEQGLIRHGFQRDTIEVPPELGGTPGERVDIYSSTMKVPE